MNWRDVPWFNILFVVVALYAMNQFSLNQNADKINDLHVAAALDAKEKENIEALYTASVTGSTTTRGR